MLCGNRSHINCKKCYGQLLYIIFEKYSISRTEFAEEITIDEATLTNYLNGKRFPNKRIAQKLYPHLRDIITANDNDDIDNETMAIAREKCSELSYVSDKNDPCDMLVNVLTDIVACSKGLPTVPPAKYEPSGRTRAIVFDFDGTLAKSYTNGTTWESIWEEIGYEVRLCRELHRQFDDKKISHAEWCEETAKYFKAKKLHKIVLQKLAVNIHLLDGVKDTFQQLQNSNIKIYIVSGSIKTIIQIVLNGIGKFVEEINANEFLFDGEGYLAEIIGTPFDFRGKATFVINLAQRLRISVKDILFVGNSHNDRFVHSAGCRTLCVNPRQTDHADKSKWDDYIVECNSLTEILPYLEGCVFCNLENCH